MAADSESHYLMFANTSSHPFKVSGMAVGGKACGECGDRTIAPGTVTMLKIGALGINHLKLAVTGSGTCHFDFASDGSSREGDCGSSPTLKYVGSRARRTVVRHQRHAGLHADLRLRPTAQVMRARRRPRLQACRTARIPGQGPYRAAMLPYRRNAFEGCIHRKQYDFSRCSRNWQQGQSGARRGNQWNGGGLRLPRRAFMPAASGAAYSNSEVSLSRQGWWAQAVFFRKMVLKSF